MNLHEFIKYGAIGLSGLLAVLIFYLIYKQSNLQTQFHINKTVNKSFTKMLYSFAGMCIFLSIVGYGSEITHDYLTKKDLNAELVKANDKIEKLNDRLVVAEKDAAVYKAVLDMIREESKKNLGIKMQAAAVVAGPNPSPEPPRPIVKKINCPIPEPKEENYISLDSDAIFKYNTKLILEGKAPLSSDQYKKHADDVKKEWDNWREKVKVWLKDHPDQKQFYWFAK